MFEDREISVKSPLAEEALFFSSMNGADEIGQCFRFELELASEDIELKAEDLLGKGLTVRVGKSEPHRYFHGLISEFGFVRIEGSHAFYRAVIRPWTWFLSKTHDTRIFQQMSVIEIVEEVLNEFSGATFEKRLQGNYEPREYCVQYCESNLHFVQRLLEHEGVCFFFEYADGEHTMVLTDANAKLKPVPGYETIPFQQDTLLSFIDGDFITDWQPTHEVMSATFVQTDYDSTKPSADLMAKSENALGHENDDGEVYHYPGYYKQLSRGDALTEVRREEVQTPSHKAHAKGTVRGMWSGATYTLEGFPREAENDEYLIFKTRYNMWDDQYRTGLDRAGAGFQVEYDVTPTALPFRPPRRTPVPFVHGPQTATVVGPGGEEIYTDEYSRVKVQFHWDRLGGNDENSSCFVRVSSVWAGAGWGFIQIPRIGQEVMVDFLEGDPDQPIITGRYYNAEQMPPYSLPDNATQSGWKSNSSPGGGGFNELRFEDKAGAEEVYFQAQKDHNELIKDSESRVIGVNFFEEVGNDAEQDVKNNRTEHVGNDKSTAVDNNRNVVIGVDDTEEVGSNRKLKVGSNENIEIGVDSTEKIGSNHTQTVGGVQSITVTLARMDNVMAAETRSVGLAQTQNVGNRRSVTVGAQQSHKVVSDDSWSIGANQIINVGGNQNLDVGGVQSNTITKDQTNKINGARATDVTKSEAHKVGEDMGVNVGTDYILEAGDTLTLKCGSSVIAMKSDGTINVECKDITVKASGKINFDAGGDIVGKGANIKWN
ncbi:type VI secretion system Vgr family protein [Aliiroseovarius sp. YM-037]|uniref:type VI secretion system Vgr family protein n=1 Tax=Aliiroseovarius sp. YM-037 TaxID=3341728 RepID=UPI003A807C31